MKLDLNVELKDTVFTNLKTYTKQLAEENLLTNGYIASKCQNGIYITKPTANFLDLQKEDLAFVCDKNIDTVDGNFKAASVILLCAMQRDDKAEFAAIVDPKEVLEYSKKQETLNALSLKQIELIGGAIKCAKKNLAIEIMTSFASSSRAVFMPNAGMLLTAPSAVTLYLAVKEVCKLVQAKELCEKQCPAKKINFVKRYVKSYLAMSKMKKDLVEKEFSKKVKAVSISDEIIHNVLNAKAKLFALGLDADVAYYDDETCVTPAFIDASNTSNLDVAIAKNGTWKTPKALDDVKSYLLNEKGFNAVVSSKAILAAAMKGGSLEVDGKKIETYHDPKAVGIIDNVGLYVHANSIDELVNIAKEMDEICAKYFA